MLVLASGFGGFRGSLGFKQELGGRFGRFRRFGGGLREVWRRFGGGLEEVSSGLAAFSFKILAVGGGLGCGTVFDCLELGACSSKS